VPPAFVLSQDQTLKLKATYVANLDVRTSAHRFNIAPTKECDIETVICFHVLQLSKITGSHSNSEADTQSSTEVYECDIQTSDPSN